MIAFVNNTTFQISDDEVFSYDSNGYINSPSITHALRGRKFDRIIPGDLRNFNEININGVRTFYNRNHVVNYENIDTHKDFKKSVNFDYWNNISDVDIKGDYVNPTLEKALDKLIYQIHIKNGDIIKINGFIFETKKGDIFRIYLYENIYIVKINEIEVSKLEKLSEIDYQRESEISDSISLYMDVTLLKKCVEYKVNFDFILNKYLNSGLDINICISHTEIGYPKFLDNTIKRSNINYIFINEGCDKFTDHLYKYISNDNRIIFNKENVYLSNETILSLMHKSKDNDVCVECLLINNRYDKYNFINYGDISNIKESNYEIYLHNIKKENDIIKIPEKGILLQNNILINDNSR